MEPTDEELAEIAAEPEEGERAVAVFTPPHIGQVRTIYPISTKVLVFTLIALMIGLVTFGMMYWDQRNDAKEARGEAAAARSEAAKANVAVEEAQDQLDEFSKRLDCIHESSVIPDVDKAAALTEMGQSLILVLSGLKAAFDNDDTTSLAVIFEQVDPQVDKTEEALAAYRASTDARLEIIQDC